MRAPLQESTGTAGASEIMGNFQRIGWAPVENKSHDLGTDLWIEARDDRRFARGLVVGAQAKSGPSWFDSPNHDDSGVVDGWWFYEPTAAHFDDWVCHSIPHLVVLHDLDLRVSYWVHVTAESCVVTGKGCKVLVPKAQTVDREHLEALLEVAASQISPGSLQGLAFSASAASVAPARRLRHALLAPRLIAPHPNTGAARPLEPEEALALLTKRRFRDLIEHVEKFPKDMPDPRVESGGQDWRWTFVRAVWLKLHDANGTALLDVRANAPNPQSRAAVEATIASMHFDDETYQQGVDLLTTSIEQDDLLPIDLAWLAIHRGRLSIEMGKRSAARSDATLALRNLRGDEDDVTAALIKGVATTIIFRTSDFGDKQLADLVNANDTAIAWWRSQSVGWALEHVVKDLFDGWSEDRSLNFSADDSAGQHLLETFQVAGWAADHGAWQGIAARLGRISIMVGARASRDIQIGYGLELLRRAGDAETIKKAVRKLLTAGPANVVRSVTESIAISNWFHTPARATLELWEQAADVLSEEYATAAARWCGERLASKGLMSEFVESCNPSFVPATAIADAFVQLLPSADVGVQELALDLIVAAPAGSVLFSQAYSRIAFRLDHDVISKYGVDLLREKAISSGSEDFAASMLFALSESGDVESGNVLLRRALGGDLNAINLVAATSHANQSNVAALRTHLKARVEAQMSDAQRGRYGFGGIDAAYLLTNFVIAFPSTDDWRVVLDFLRDPAVAAEHKTEIAGLLARRAEELDSSVKNEIAGALDAMTRSRNVMPGRTNPLPALIVQLGISVGMGSANDVGRIAALLTGNSNERSVGSRMLGLGRAPELRSTLLSLVSDRDSSVRAAACKALGNLVRNGDDSQSTQVAVRRIVENKGLSMPLSFMSGLAAGSFNGPPWALDLAEAQKISSISRRMRSASADLLQRVAARH